MSNLSELFSNTTICSSFKWIEPLFFELINNGNILFIVMVYQPHYRVYLLIYSYVYLFVCLCIR